MIRSMTNRRPAPPRLWPLLFGLLAVLLTACGTTDTDDAAGDTAGDDTESSTGGGGEADGDDGGDGEAPADDGCEGDDTVTSTEPVSVTDDFGRTVELDQPAQRVAALEWQQVEDVLTLCLTPVAVADVEGYGTWVQAVPLPDGVADAGNRGQPNVDALLSAEPDLVIVEATAADDPVIAQIEGLGVPVLATKGADAADPVAHMLDTFHLIAEATGRTERADVVTAEFEESLAAAEAEVAGLELAIDEFVYLDGWIEGGNIALRPFGQGSLVGEIGEALGLTNAWEGEVDEAYGLGQTDIEGITVVGDAMILYTGTVDPAGDILAELAENPIWKAMPAVEDGRIQAFPIGTWTFGGPRSTQQIIDAYVDVLTEQAAGSGDVG